MLHLKIKQILQSRGVLHPQIWLRKALGIGQNKAARLEKDTLEYISLRDLSLLCQLLHCTPNDLFYWQQTASHTLPADHPCLSQLKAPPIISEWSEIMKGLSATQAEELLEKIRKDAEAMKG